MDQTAPQGPPWWWCLEHSRVEAPEGCANIVRLGPYATREEASRALELARERTESWDHDPAWNDDPDE